MGFRFLPHSVAVLYINADSLILNITVSMPEKTEKHLRVNESDPEKWELSWFKITYLIVLHVSAVYGLYLLLFHAKICTVLWGKWTQVERAD